MGRKKTENSKVRYLTPEQKIEKSHKAHEWYLENQERLKEKTRQKYHSNPEHYKEDAKRWAREHRDVLKKRYAERLKNMSAEELQIHKEKISQYNRKYKARKEKPAGVGKVSGSKYLKIEQPEKSPRKRIPEVLVFAQPTYYSSYGVGMSQEILKKYEQIKKLHP